MHHAHGVLGKHFANLFESLFEVFQIDFLAFLYQRVNNIHLTPLLDLPAYRLVKFRPAIIVPVYRRYRFTTGWQFVDYRHVEIAVNRHRQRARDRSGRHYKDMGRPRIFPPQTRTLLDSETVLLIDDDKA